MYTSIVRRSTVKVRNQTESNGGEFQEKFKGFRKRLVAERKRLETRRVENFRGLFDSVRKMVDDEVAFVKEVCNSSVEFSKKTDDVSSTDDAFEPSSTKEVVEETETK